jgi:hypothetical protein
MYRERYNRSTSTVSLSIARRDLKLCTRLLSEKYEMSTRTNSRYKVLLRAPCSRKTSVFLLMFISIQVISCHITAISFYKQLNLFIFTLSCVGPNHILSTSKLSSNKPMTWTGDIYIATELIRQLVHRSWQT